MLLYVFIFFLLCVLLLLTLTTITFTHVRYKKFCKYNNIIMVIYFYWNDGDFRAFCTFVKKKHTKRIGDGGVFSRVLYVITDILPKTHVKKNVSDNKLFCGYTVLIFIFKKVLFILWIANVWIYLRLSLKIVNF